MSERDREILTTLCFCVRFFSLEQIARAWWSGSMPPARRWVRRSSASGWVTSVRAPARQLLPLEEPVVFWRPSEAEPDARNVSRLLRRRWKRPAVQNDFILAGPRSRGLFGGRTPPRIKNPCQTTHDLHVAEIYLHYRRNAPDLVRHWRGEDALEFRLGTKIPDAVLLDSEGTVLRVVEFGGSYGEERVAELHRHCAERSLPYELW